MPQRHKVCTCLRKRGKQFINCRDFWSLAANSLKESLIFLYQNLPGRIFCFYTVALSFNCLGKYSKFYTS